jgi:uncharacterized SAM-binding protein YcdF (DUF218 family)
MTLSIFLAQLLIPLNLGIALLIVAVVLLMLRWRRSAGLLAAIACVWVLFWSLPASTLWAGGRLEQLYPYHPPGQVPVAQAIVVLGGSTANNRHNWFMAYEKQKAITRVDTAARLFQAGRAPLVFVSGAFLEGELSEAEVMAQELREQGVPDSAIVIESESLTTRENALFTARQLREHHIKKVLVVTSALHMPRAIAAFHKQGFDPIAAPSPPQIVVPEQPGFSFWLPNWRALQASRSIVKEYAGMLIYWLRGWI